MPSVGHIEACLVATNNYLYALISSTVFVLNLTTHQWQINATTQLVPGQEIATCAMDKYQEYIYIFPIDEEYIYKYHVQTRTFSYLDEINLCSHGVGSAATLKDNKAYLHGCSVSSWQTLIFDLETEQFETMMGIWSWDVDEESFGKAISSSLPGLITPTFGGGQLWLQFRDGWTGTPYVLSCYPFLSWISFSSSSSTLNSATWPTDGILIVYDWYGYTDYSALITIDCSQLNISNKIVIQTGNWTPIEYLLSTEHIQTYFSLESYREIDSQLHQFSCDLFSYDLENGGFLYRFIESAPETIQVTVNRCKIQDMRLVDAFITNKEYDHTIKIKYNISEECHLPHQTHNDSTFPFIIEVKRFGINVTAIINITNHTTKSYECQLCTNAPSNQAESACTHHCNQSVIVLQHQQHVENGETVSVVVRSQSRDLLIGTDKSVTLSIEYALQDDQPVPTASLIIIAACLSVLLLVVAVLVRRHQKLQRALKEKDALEAQYTHYVKNPLVVFVGVGLYRRDPHIKPGFDEYCYDLDGIDADYRNMYKLCDVFNYDFHPKSGEKYEWKQDEIIDLINETARKLEDNLDTLNEDPRNPKKHVNGYDGLLMIFSGHGLRKNIVSSDYQLIEKTAIHRLISTNHPGAREVPRIVMFDCCDGSQQRGVINRYLNQPETEKTKQDDTGKNFNVSQIKSVRGTVWKGDEKNPDYKLCEIHAANEGYQAKLHIVHGSYLIREFFSRMIDSITDNENDAKQMPFIGDMMDGIQEKLHDSGKQHIRAVFNDRTRYIKLIQNRRTEQGATNVQPQDTELEMYHLMSDPITVD